MSGKHLAPIGHSNADPPSLGDELGKVGHEPTAIRFLVDPRPEPGADPFDGQIGFF